VAANDTHLNVGKGAWTWNPAPDTDFVYNVNVCNNGSTASSEVTLTDTLPLSTTLPASSWWGQDAGWEEVSSSDHLLVVRRPSLAAWSCSEVYLRVHLDAAAWPGMELVNSAAISADNDLETDDNETTLDHSVGVPLRTWHQPELALGLVWCRAGISALWHSHQ
jgi:uncharacterized repeat protein (TIGR01451 family)